MSDQTHDWSVLSVDGVGDVILQAATKVARQFEHDPDDLQQEAGILVCDLRTNLPECVLGQEEPQLGMLQYRLEQDLVDKFKTDVSHRNQQVSFEERYDEPEGGDDERMRTPVSIAQREAVSGYTRELVESLIPAIWDADFCYGVKVENAPDADMPRGSTNKATGNTLAAHIADIKVGWKKSPLTRRERQAIFLHLGLDWSQREAAFNLGITREAVSQFVTSGVGKIVAELNGDGALMRYLVTGEVAA